LGVGGIFGSRGCVWEPGVCLGAMDDIIWTCNTMLVTHSLVTCHAIFHMTCHVTYHMTFHVTCPPSQLSTNCTVCCATENLYNFVFMQYQSITCY